MRKGMWVYVAAHETSIHLYPENGEPFMGRGWVDPPGRSELYKLWEIVRDKGHNADDFPLAHAPSEGR
jgi:hypothetical protein